MRTSHTTEWHVSILETPNPEAMKFVANQKIADETRVFKTEVEALVSPLAKKLFGFPWAKEILIGPDFVSVVKQDWVDWGILAEPLAELIREHLDRGEGVLPTGAPAAVLDDSDPIVAKIKQILDAEIRPAVAMDGGDILFNKFEGGRVYLHMVGACSGCPSSTFTLKEGIETRLKELIPEITEVVSV